MKIKVLLLLVILSGSIVMPGSVVSQIGRQFPSEKKVIKDTVTGTELTFLTSTPAGDRKIYPTHNQWTSDGQWLIFASRRADGEAMAVNEKTGDMVQVSEGGYKGMLNIARKSMKLYYMRETAEEENKGSLELIEVDLASLFADSKEGTLKPEKAYQRVCGKTPAEFGAAADFAMDADEEWAWFRVGASYAKKHLPEGIPIESSFGPRGMGAGPSGIAGMNINSGEIKYVVSVPFQVGHIQSNPWIPGEIVFCWETGGKSPQRTWIVSSDGTGLRPLYPESDYEWVTHEVVFSPDEVALAIMGHREIMRADQSSIEGENREKNTEPGKETDWGPSGTREKPTGLGIVNIRTREMSIVGQIPYGSGFWHVSGSPDGRFAAGDNFNRDIYLIDRHTHEMILLSTGHKTSAADHPHPTFSPDGTKIQIQSAMLSEDNRTLNICIIPVPEKWLIRNLCED